MRALHVVLPGAKNSEACGGTVFDGRFKLYSHALAVERLLHTLRIRGANLQHNGRIKTRQRNQATLEKCGQT
jgi:hypothetical protein